MLQFILGVIIGGLFGIVIMCLMQINRDENVQEYPAEVDFEKSTPVGVDNPAKKA